MVALALGLTQANRRCRRLLRARFRRRGTIVSKLLMDAIANLALPLIQILIAGTPLCCLLCLPLFANPILKSRLLCRLLHQLASGFLQMMGH